mgnify:CR=1 FL=1
MIIRVTGSSPEIIILTSSEIFGGITIEIENNKIIRSVSNVFGKGITGEALFKECANNLLGLTQDEAVNLVKTYLLCFGSN